MKLRIPILRRIVELARKYADQDTELAIAFGDLQQAEADADKAYKDALQSHGVNCPVCGKRHIPRPDAISSCCSIGCQFK
jgi:hypothetical protein